MLDFLPDWPKWALNLLLIMSVVMMVVLSLTNLLDVSKKPSEEKVELVASSSKLESEFLAFRREYLLVYTVIMLADWMQGTHMYTLYLSYGVNISGLFLTGFLSGAIFAPFMGSAVDRYGRRNSCVVYCLLEIVINTLEHSTHYPTLLVGRVLGGISTNLLFSAFESWMTTEHRRRKFPEAWLARTFSGASILNGTSAVLAGIVAQVLEDALGQIGPFQGAIALTALALVLVAARWNENYGENEKDTAAKKEETSLTRQLIEGWVVTISDSRVWRIGLTQALSEGAMYTFVFMWVPTLLSLDPPGGLPTGCVFSSLMMAITVGGALYPPLESGISRTVASTSTAPEVSASFIYAVAAASMAVPALCSSSDGCFTAIVSSFIAVEICVGLFMPVAGTLRSKHVPDAQQGAILNIFRLPLNAVVVAGTYATDLYPPAQVFTAVSACFLAASLLQLSMVLWVGETTTPSKKKD